LGEKNLEKCKLTSLFTREQIAYELETFCRDNNIKLNYTPNSFRKRGPAIGGPLNIPQTYTEELLLGHVNRNNGQYYTYADYLTNFFPNFKKIPPQKQMEYSETLFKIRNEQEYQSIFFEKAVETESPIEPPTENQS
jgi:hypothetical protein